MYQKTTKTVLAVLACLAVSSGQAAQPAGQAGAPPAARPAPTPAPAAGAPAIDRTAADLAAALKASMAQRDPATAPIATNDQYYINVVHRGKPGGALAHAGWTELHYVISGGAVFVTGGTLKRGEAGGDGGTIEGGVTRTLKVGDTVVVPPNTPHWYKQINGDLVYLEVRFIAPVAAAK